MSRCRKDPSYRLHKQSGQAIVTLPDAFGGRRDVLLGKYGTPESRAEYRRMLAEWEANGQKLLKRPRAVDELSVNEVILSYWGFVEGYYRRPDGSPGSEANNIKLALRWLRQLYGHTPAANFDSLALEAVREQMIKTGLCRNRINKDIARIRRMFKWAASKKIVAASVYVDLQTIEGLRAGRSKARETERVLPVPLVFVESSLPFMRPQVAAMVQIQLHTGMRPGEVLIMRTIDLEMAGKVWLYRPGSDRGPYGEHKNAWRGQDRIIAIGPKAQEILRPWLRLNLEDYLFQPREAEAQRDAERRLKRKTPMTPSQARRTAKRNPMRQPGSRYTIWSYNQAIRNACLRADKHAHEQDTTSPSDQIIIPCWHPNQLRHTKATEIRREAGLDAARAVLGHRSPQITETYAEIDVNKAAEIMARLG
jgi:integrase